MRLLFFRRSIQIITIVQGKGGGVFPIYYNLKKGGGPLGTPNGFPIFKVADVDSLSAKAKLPTKIFVKCAVFARNCNFVHLIQCNMQDIPFNDALLAQETLLLS